MTLRLALEQTYAVYAAVVVVVIMLLGAYGLVQPIHNSSGTTSYSNGTSRTTATTTFAFAPYGLLYLSSAPGCLANGVPAPCLGSLSTAVIFNCVTAARSLSGCTQRVYINGSASKSYVVTIWYNATLGNSTFGYSSGLSWINCKYSVRPASGPSLFYAYYVALNSTSFMVGSPAPGPSSA
ncbi:MAG TPA: hypothetical protein VEB87_04235 [Nitrososphaerales archaeon]|nr:hypothetical protein [Nitrososphaerales archaeon]